MSRITIKTDETADSHAKFRAMDEHRRVLRVSLLEPLAGKAGEERVFVVDASLRGLRISHLTLFSPRAEIPIAFDWEGSEIDVVAAVRWTKLQRIGTAAYAKSVYQSGVEITSIREDTEGTLRGLVEHHVERALDEQKANARGVPPLGAQSVQSGEASTYARHELVNGVWRKIVTTDRAQPLSGFTVSSEETRDQVEMLRSAYEIADLPMRQMIRKLAEMSVSVREGIPMRKYTP